MKTKRLLSVVLTLCMVFSMFTVLTLTATVPASAESVETETAIFIGSTSKLTAAFIPMDITQDNDGSTAMTGTHYYQISFKCKILKNGTSGRADAMPSIGILHPNSKAQQTETDPAWAGDYNNNTGATYTSGVYTSRFSINYSNAKRRDDASDAGYRSFYITIGNAAPRNESQNSYVNYGVSFIFSDITLYECDSDGSNVQEENLIPAINDDNIDFKGTYFMRKDCAATWDSPFGATTGKWHVLSMPNDVKAITVPSDYNTSSSYDAANFTKQGDTAYIREYYTNSNYSDLTFAKLADSNNAGFEVIPDDVNKKMIIIDANHEDEPDSNSGDGAQYSPTKNKPANIFIPISFGQYSMTQIGVTSNIDYLLKITMKAVRLEGEGHPVLGRIVGCKNDTSGNNGRASQAMAYSCYNIDTGDYYANPVTGNETINDTSGNRIAYTYNEATGDFVGYIRVRASDNDYASRWGINEIITIGNAERAPGVAKFDSTAFNSSFAISDITMDVYAYSGKMGDLVASDIAPHFYADTVDDTSNWAYQCKGSNAYSNYANDLIRSSQYKWCVDGCTGMVHAENLTACMNGVHALERHAATAATREYWGCSNCRKVYADPYGKEEITDTSATKQILVLPATGDASVSAFMPVKISTISGYQWFKFTCKVKCFGEGEPVVSTIRNVYNGTNQAAATASNDDDGDMSVVESSYDAATGTLTGYIKCWTPSNYNKGDRYPYLRYNPLTGANLLIVVGNGRYSATDGSAYLDTTYTTTFAISEPELYKLNCTTSGNDGLSTAKTASILSENLATPITDKTVNFTDDYVKSFTAANNPMAAPIGKWYRTGVDRTDVKNYNTPDGFFEGTTNNRVLRASGPTNNSNVMIACYETFIDSNTTYQFDLDYSVFGGAEPRIFVQTANKDSGYSTLTEAVDTVNGNHITYEFTTGTLRGSGGGNFKIQLGVSSESQNNQTTVYFSNASLCKKTGSTLGPNHLINGDFSLTPDSFNGIYTTSMTDSEIEATVPCWSDLNNSIIGAVKGSKRYYNVTLLQSSGYIFGSEDATGKSDIAIKLNGHASFGTQLKFYAGLKPSTKYRLVFNYRTNGDEPELSADSTKSGVSAPTVTMTNRFPRGNFSAQYDITTNSSYTNSPNSYGNANTKFIFKLGGYSQGKSLYISGVTLYELSGDSPVGGNIVGELNPVLPDGVYDAVIPNAGNEYPVLYNDSGEKNMNRYVAVGWYGFNEKKDYSTENGSVVKVSSDFFQRTAYSTRIKNLANAVVGNRTADAMNPDYNPNGDSVVADVRDLVHMKIKNLNYEKVFNGGAQAKAEYMIKNIIDVKNDSSGDVEGGNSWFVSESKGNNNNTGIDADHPLKWISTANSKAKAGDTIYLKRGDTWRTTEITADSVIELKSGVHYAAYGNGEKPVISGSAEDYADNNWYQLSGNPNIWYTTYYSGNATTKANAGMIYFIDNKGKITFGKSIAKPSGDESYSYSFSDLDSDLEFFAPIKIGSTTEMAGNSSLTFGRIYVYSTKNPTKRFSTIEIATNHPQVVYANSGTNGTDKITTMNNIAVKYGGYHGVTGVNGGRNVILNKCEVAYIGGGNQGYNRLGNGVEFGDGYTNGRVYDSYIHDCFDAGLTFQSYNDSSSGFEFSYICFERNVIENCAYGIEFFTENPNDRMWDIRFNNNVIRNAGYGQWSEQERADGGWRISNICGSKNNYMNLIKNDGRNCQIKNNIFDCTRNVHVSWYWNSSDSSNARHENLDVSGNTYFQKKGALDDIDSPRVMNYGKKSTGDGTKTGGNLKYASSRDAFVAAVATFDDDPMGVYWLDDNH